MLRISVVSQPPPDPAVQLYDYETLRFLPAELPAPDIRAVLNRAPVKELDPYPFSTDPSYLS